MNRAKSVGADCENQSVSRLPTHTQFCGLVYMDWIILSSFHVFKRQAFYTITWILHAVIRFLKIYKGAMCPTAVVFCCVLQSLERTSGLYMIAFVEIRFVLMRIFYLFPGSLWFFFFSMELNTSAIVDIELIPRWLSGNKGSFPFLSMGCIIALYQVLCIIFLSKHFYTVYVIHHSEQVV